MTGPRERWKPTPATASALLALLAQRHRRDLFFPEVKDGPTIFDGHLRLDAVAIYKSWSPVRVVGYEIKVDRSDWLGDRKWEAYRELVHEFWIVAPRGVVEPPELPDGVGLLRPAETGTMLRTERKAARRDVALPGELLLYLLMSRTIPGDPHRARERTREERVADWATWFATEKEAADLGYRIKGAIREKLKELAARGDDRALREAHELGAWLRERGALFGTLLERVQQLPRIERQECDYARERLARVTKECATLLLMAPALVEAAEKLVADQEKDPKETTL